MGCPAQRESSSGEFCFYGYYDEGADNPPQYAYPGEDPHEPGEKWQWQEIIRPQKCIEENKEA
jgi:hypothetical protein